MTVAVGDLAPAFSLAGTDGTEDGYHSYALQDYHGHPVVLVFYPGDETPVCTKQLRTYTEEIDGFRNLSAQVLAMSPQSVASHDDFAAHHGGFAFPLLSDPSKATGRAYNVVGPMGFYRRSVVVVDGHGVVRYIHRALAGLSFRPAGELIEQVRRVS